MAPWTELMRPGRRTPESASPSGDRHTRPDGFRGPARDIADRYRIASELYAAAAAHHVEFECYCQSIARRRSVDVVALGALRRACNDLEWRASSLRHIMLAMKPPCAAEPGCQIAELIESFVDDRRMAGGGVEVEIEVDDCLALDWTMETAVLCVVEKVFAVFADQPGTHRVRVVVTATERGVMVQVEADGDHGELRLAKLRSRRGDLAELLTGLGGTLSVDRGSSGTSVCAHLPSQRPHWSDSTTLELDG